MLQKLVRIEKNYQRTDKSEHQFDRHLFAEIGTERRGDNSADNEPENDFGIALYITEHRDKGRRFSDRYKKLCRIDRSDRSSGIVTGSKKRACDDRAPAAAAHSVRKTAGKTERDRVVAVFTGLAELSEDLRKYEASHDKKVNIYNDINSFTLKTDQKVRTYDTAQDPGEKQPEE